jgi:S-adenosylhomocysteine hydrolase
MMKLEVHHYFHEGGPDVNRKLDAILGMLQESKNREVQMSAELDALTTKVEETTTVVGSAIALLGGLATQVAALKNDPAKLQALADTLQATKQSLADAIVANTPAV